MTNFLVIPVNFFMLSLRGCINVYIDHKCVYVRMFVIMCKNSSPYSSYSSCKKMDVHLWITLLRWGAQAKKKKHKKNFSSRKEYLFRLYNTESSIENHFTCFNDLVILTPSGLYSIAMTELQIGYTILFSKIISLGTYFEHLPWLLNLGFFLLKCPSPLLLSPSHLTLLAKSK